MLAGQYDNITYSPLLYPVPTYMFSASCFNFEFLSASPSDDWFGVGALAEAAIPDEIAMKNHYEMAAEAMFKLTTPLHLSDMRKLLSFGKLPKPCVCVMKAIKSLLPDLKEVC